MGNAVSSADSVPVVLLRVRLETLVFRFLCEDLTVRLKTILSHDPTFSYFVQNGTSPLRKDRRCSPKVAFGDSYGILEVLVPSGRTSHCCSPNDCASHGTVRYKMPHPREYDESSNLL